MIFISQRAIIENFPTIITEIGKNILEEQFGKAEERIDLNISKEIGEKHPYDYTVLENAYLQVPIIKGGIDKTVDFVIGPGFFIKTKSESTKKKIEEFMEIQDFNTWLRRIIRDALVFGSAFSERVGESFLKPLNPKYIFIRRDNKGKLLGYSQWMGSGKPILFTPDEIVHFPLDPIGDTPYGTSVIRPLVGSAKVSPLSIYLESQKISNTILNRRGNPPMHVKVGSDQFPASSADVTTVANELSDLQAVNEFVTNHTVDIGVLQYRGRIPELQPFFDNYENIIIYGLQVPAVLLGRANVPEGLANVQMDAFERRAKSIQAFIEKEIETKIFKFLTPEKVEFEWGQPTMEMEDLELTRLMNLMKTPDLSPITKLDIESKIRILLGLEQKKIPLPKKPEKSENPIKPKNPDINNPDEEL